MDFPIRYIASVFAIAVAGTLPLSAQAQASFCRPAEQSAKQKEENISYARKDLERIKESKYGHPYDFKGILVCLNKSGFDTQSDEAYAKIGTTRREFEDLFQEVKDLALVDAKKKFEDITSRGTADFSGFHEVIFALSRAGLDTKTDAAYTPLGMTRQEFNDFREKINAPKIKKYWADFSWGMKYICISCAMDADMAYALIKDTYDSENNPKVMALIGTPPNYFSDVLLPQLYCYSRGGCGKPTLPPMPK